MIVFKTIFTGMKILRDKKPENLYRAITTPRKDRGRVPVREVEIEGFYETRHWRNAFNAVQGQTFEGATPFALTA